MSSETGLDELDDRARGLVLAARAAAERAHAPYSSIHVGAAIECADGRVFHGCNVENASYGLTMCAERVAVGAAVVGGARRIVTVATYSDRVPVLMPCGACRQVLAEFAPAETTVLCGAGDGSVHATTVGELLPAAMGPRDITG